MKKLLIFLVVLGIGFVGAAYWVNNSNRSRKDDGFTLAPTEFGSITDTISATGLVQPRDIAAVNSEIPGFVVKIEDAADFNLEVKENQPLLKLDDRMASLKRAEADDTIFLAEKDLKRAESVFSSAQTAWEKMDSLVKTGVGGYEKDRIKAQFDLDAAEAGVETAKANIRKARTAKKLAQLGYDLTVVRSPIAGTIIDKKVFLGQPVGPVPSPVAMGNGAGASKDASGSMMGGPLFIIAKDLSRMQVQAQVAESDVTKVREGLSAHFTVYAYSEGTIPFEGIVQKIREMPNNIQGAVFYSVIIEVANRRDGKNWMLRPGMTATVDIVRRTHSKVWKVPAAAVSFQLEENYQTEAAKAKLEKWQEKAAQESWKYVWVIKDNKPWPVFVKTGGPVDKPDSAAIKDGLFQEVLEWDPELQIKPDAKAPETFPRVIIAAPPATKSLFDRGALKIS